MSRHFWKTADSAPPLEQTESRSLRDLFGGGGGTTQTSSTPWGPSQPYLQDIFQRAEHQATQGQYQGPYLAPQSPYSQQAIQQQAMMAQDPNSLVGQSQRELGRTISGDYMSITGNPAIQAAVDAARRTVNSQFSGDNYGSSAHQEWLGRGAASAAAPLLSQERQNQLAALQMAPGLQQANIAQLSEAGTAQENRGQAEIAAQQQQFYSPWDLLSRYQQSINGGASLGGTQTQPYFTNPLGAAAGGAGAGYMIGGPWGAAAGGLLGLLSGRR